MFPAYLRDTGLGIDMTGAQRRPNLSPAAQHYLDSLDANVEDLFHHVIAVLHDPAYLEANAGALRMEWPRIPLPGWPDGGEDGRPTRPTSSPRPPREAGSSQPCSTPTLPSPASPSRSPEPRQGAPCAPRSPPSPYPPSPAAAT